MSTACKPARTSPCGQRARRREWQLCRCFARRRLRREHGTQNGGRRGRDQLRPECQSVVCQMMRCSCTALVARTTPIFRSTVAILLFAPAFNNLLDTIFSSARMTPSLHLMPIAVPPFSTALTAYSTWCRVSTGSVYGKRILDAFVLGSFGHLERRQSLTDRSRFLSRSE